MNMVAELVDHVIGVDPDRDWFHTAAVDPLSLGEVTEPGRFSTTRDGCDEAVEWADGFSHPDRRVWSIEGSGSYGATLLRVLRAHGEWVIEFPFPLTKAARDGAKTDHLDALRAAREILGRDSIVDPRNLDGDAGAIRTTFTRRELAVKHRTSTINALKAEIVTGPVELRDQLRGLSTTKVVQRCATFRITSNGDPSDETQAVKRALRSYARTIGHYTTEITEFTTVLETQIETKAPILLAQHGVGAVTAAPILMAWSHPGRIRSEAAFAALGGVNPVPVISGQQQGRHRLNRGGDRILNRALHQITITLTAHCDETKEFFANQTAQGKTRRDARRKLKRYLARRYYRLLENTT